MRSLRAIAVIVLLAAVAGCSAQMDPDRTLHGSSPSNTLAPPSTSRTTIAEGDVTRVDTGQRVIVLSNGQMYQVPADSVVYVNGQPVAWTTVHPGSHVLLTQGQLLEVRGGRTSRRFAVRGRSAPRWCPSATSLFTSEASPWLCSGRRGVGASNGADRPRRTETACTASPRAACASPAGTSISLVILACAVS